MLLKITDNSLRVLALCAERFILPFNLHSRLRYKYFHPHFTYVEAEAR